MEAQIAQSAIKRGKLFRSLINFFRSQLISIFVQVYDVLFVWFLLAHVCWRILIDVFGKLQEIN